MDELGKCPDDTLDLGSSWGRRNNRKSALTWPEKIMKEKSCKPQASSFKLDSESRIM